ncbi:hypothetical protein [Algoriphagus persicinus]|uniref:hypothetical protein n=1 Tax=Algoriphagus persicinus TaxID=3108754 RepID=UPI002B38E8C2|nr:hypothetical protein [Algoriphagus sp. E1-3-M2]MEB2785526.1 hypothetical protein [Algoriphagus sp. E1-3-M2]
MKINGKKLLLIPVICREGLIVVVVCLQLLVVFSCGLKSGKGNINIIQPLKEPKSVNITDLYSEVLNKPYLKMEITTPKYFRYKDKWVIFVSAIPAIYVLDSEGNILFNKEYGNSEGILGGERTIIGGVDKVVINGKFLYSMFHDKVLKIDLENLYEETINIKFPKGISFDDNCFFISSEHLLLSLGDVYEDQRSDLFLVDLGLRTVKSIYNISTMNIPRPYLLARQLDRGLGILKLDMSEIQVTNLKGATVDHIKFKNPLEYQFRSTPRSTNMSQLEERMSRLNSDKYLDFYVTEDKLFVLYKIMSNDLATREKYEIMMAITDLENGEIDKFYLDRDLRGFSRDGSVYFIEETDGEAKLVNLPLAKLRDLEKKDVSYPF